MKARPTTYKGIVMRSRLEASRAEQLDRIGRRWTYEPMCFASPAGQYLPDFRIDHGGLVPIDGTEPTVWRFVHAYEEIKPAPFAKDFDWIERTQYQMTIIWASEPDAELVIYVPETGDLWIAFGYERSGEWYHRNPGYPCPRLQEEQERWKKGLFNVPADE